MRSNGPVLCLVESENDFYVKIISVRSPYRKNDCDLRVRLSETLCKVEERPSTATMECIVAHIGRSEQRS